MSLKETLQQDLKNAMKAKNVFKRDVIRFLMSAIKQVEVDERRVLSDNDIIKLIQKSVKQREDSATQYKEAGREDLYEKETKEANLLKTYLPTQLSDDELKQIIQDVITQTKASSMKDMGKVMGLSISKTQGLADGKRINNFVKMLLSGINKK